MRLATSTRLYVENRRKQDHLQQFFNSLPTNHQEMAQQLWADKVIESCLNELDTCNDCGREVRTNQLATMPKQFTAGEIEFIQLCIPCFNRKMPV
jgi:hypothetical protein